MIFITFTRTWWKHNPAWPNGLEPHIGAAEFYELFETEKEAQDYCKEYNSENDPGN